MDVIGLCDGNADVHGKLPALERLKSESEQLEALHLPMGRCGSSSIAFAPDQSHFAWSCDPKTVAVIPWTELCRSKTSSPPQLNPLMINCDDIVCSLAFGMPSASQSRPHTMYNDSDDTVDMLAPDFYNFRSAQNRLILAVGLKHGRIRLYSIYDSKFLTELLDHKAAVQQLRFSLDDSFVLLSASRDSTLKLWDLFDDCNMFKTLKHHSRGEWVTCCAFSFNGRFAASGGTYSTIFVYNTSDWTLEHALHGHLNAVTSCEFSVDSALLASASYDTTVILWNFVNETRLLTFRHMLPSPRLMIAGGSNGHYVLSLSFSSDGGHIVTICEDGFLRLWSLFEAGRSAIAVAGVSNATSALCSPNGSLIAASTKEGYVHLFASCMRVSSLQRICRIALRKCVQLEHIDLLSLPEPVKSFLRYESL